MGDATLSWEVADRVATVWLDRPPVNAVDQDLYRELSGLFEDLGRLGDDVRAVVLAGRGRHFCAGNDLGEFQTMTPANAPARMREVRRAFFAIQDAPLPVIGAVRGSALGTGLAIAASCDFIVAAEGARLGTPEVSVGVMGAARHLMRLLPQPVVRWMYLTGEPLPVEELRKYGAVIEIVPADQLLDAARSHAARITRHGPVTIGFAKRALNRVEKMELQEGYEYEQSLTAELCGYPESKEALAAVVEKREARL
ncbi:enoyl-CoA hydratase-related protein [Actinomadura livida]|uniref:Enoyl-CoA hydratase n=1 Tax=Actinomadura livida TaxID=79909 RepID=A0A7W7IFB5_9ACTN|nr:MULTISPECIES: enoyl-CoA hydratase-related protein [Actinomadura]MBB4775930.1 enoyl-CoA hydratase [Actinomadura catellatispora]GGU16685.1 enoyl-CoA hydratase [Actinomadura livida]